MRSSSPVSCRLASWRSAASSSETLPASRYSRGSNGALAASPEVMRFDGVEVTLADEKYSSSSKYAIYQTSLRISRVAKLDKNSLRSLYLKKRTHQNDAKLDARRSLQCRPQRSTAGQCPAVHFFTPAGRLVIWKRPGPIADTIVSAAIKCVLDATEGLGIVAAKEALPDGREHAVAHIRGRYIGEEERG